MQNDRAVRLYLVQKEPKTLKSGGYMQVYYTSEHAFILYFRTFIYEHRNPTVQIYTKYHILFVYLIDNLYPDYPYLLLQRLCI